MSEKDMLHIEQRKQKEIEHSDRRRSIVKAYEYLTDTADGHREENFIKASDEYAEHFSNMKFYSITRSSFAWRDSLLYKDIKGAVALDYCCGNGEVAVEMARRGARKVFGIDISEVAIQNSQELARAYGLEKICEFCVMDAEKTEFPANTFDIIHEYGALHHLELKTAFAELARILKPAGKLICTEALRHNPFIHWYRTRTPHLRTQWEVKHILGIPEIDRGRFFFKDVKKRMFHMAALAAVPIRRSRFFIPILSILEVVDTFILSIPYVNQLAWVAVVEYRRPKKVQG
jgi:ubiquinone/menaquinone biosynthesis C-methylase UbiE